MRLELDVKGLFHPKVIGSARNRSVYVALSQVASAMRKESTSAERILWNELRNKKLGVKFRRQHVIDKFIVDFYCVELGLVIEVEGDIHKKQKEADMERARILEAWGCSLIYFSNETVQGDLQGVIGKIKEQIRILS